MNHDVLDRRNFLKATLLGGAALALPLGASRSLAANAAAPAAAAAAAAPAAAAKATSRVAVTAGEDRADLAFQGLKIFSKEIAAAIGDKRVIVKPNNVSISIPLCASDAKNLEGILEFLKSIGKDKNAVIAESPADGTAMQGAVNSG